MPGKLVIVLVLYGISILLNFFTGSWLAAAIQIGCFVGLVKANDVVRKIVIFFNCLGLAWLAVQTVQVINLLDNPFVADAGGGLLFIAFGAIAFGFVCAVFTIWALTRSDVKQWMLYRNMSSLESHLGGPTTF